MFKRLHEPTATVELNVDGVSVTAQAGDSVAAVLLLLPAAPALRTTPLSQTRRAPYCLIGQCFECLVEIDGRENCQACTTVVAAGMQVRRQWKEVSDASSS